MNRVVQIGAGILGGVALLGVGVAVGSNVGQPETIVISQAPAEPVGLSNPQEAVLLQTFVRSATDFQTLIKKAQNGDTSVGKAMTQQAVTVRAVYRNAQTPELRDAADAVSQAMLLLSAGVTTGEGGVTQEGINAFNAANEKVQVLSDKVVAEKGVGSPSPSPSVP